MNKLDPVSVATSIAGIYYGPDIAAVVGPYAVIVLGSTLGTAWSLGRHEATTKLAALRYFLLLNSTALFITVSLSRYVASLFGTEDFHWLLSPIAIAIGAVGKDWPAIIKWAVNHFYPAKRST